jgi:hypothetical protein
MPARHHQYEAEIARIDALASLLSQVAAELARLRAQWLARGLVECQEKTRKRGRCNAPAHRPAQTEKD